MSGPCPCGDLGRQLANDTRYEIATAVLDPYTATLRFDDAASDRKAEPETIPSRDRCLLAESREFVEDLVPVDLRNPVALVLDNDTDLRCRRQMSRQADPRSGRRISRRVIEQRKDDLGDGRRVHDELRNVGSDLDLEFAPCKLIASPVDCIRDDLFD